jgi:hypothetical protein
MTHSFFTQMGGITVSLPGEPRNPAQLGWVTDETLSKLISNGHLEQSFIPTKAEIVDKGKADKLVKSIALIQSLWILVQVIARAIQHLPVTTLEIATLAFLPCATLISFFWWTKPMDVSEPINLRVSSIALRPNQKGVSSDDTPLTEVQSHHYTRYPLLQESTTTVSTVLVRINW